MDATGINVIPNDGKTHADRIRELEERLLPTSMPATECPLIHLFSPGIYMRGILMPAGHYILGHEHTQQHYNFVLTGKALVVVDGVEDIVQAPCIFESKPGVRKLLIILEDMRWVTVHPNPTDERDIGKLEASFVRKSDAWLKYHQEIDNQKPQITEEAATP